MTLGTPAQPIGSGNEINQIDFTVGTEAADSINVALASHIAGASAPSQACAMQAYLSTDALGQTLASAPSAGVAVGTDGTILVESVANVVFTFVTEADGDADFDIGEVGVGTWYLNVILPTGRIVTSPAITFA